MQNDYDFKQAVNSLVKQRKISKRILSERTGLSYYCLTLIPDNWTPSLGTVLILCEALQISFYSFLKFSSHKSSTVSTPAVFNAHEAFENINRCLSARSNSSPVISLKWKSRFDRYCQACKQANCTPEDIAKMAEQI